MQQRRNGRGAACPRARTGERTDIFGGRNVREQQERPLFQDHVQESTGFWRPSEAELAPATPGCYDGPMDGGCWRMLGCMCPMHFGIAGCIAASQEWASAHCEVVLVQSGHLHSLVFFAFSPPLLRTPCDLGLPISTTSAGTPTLLRLRQSPYLQPNDLSTAYTAHLSNHPRIPRNPTLSPISVRNFDRKPRIPGSARTRTTLVHWQRLTFLTEALVHSSGTLCPNPSTAIESNSTLSLAASSQPPLSPPSPSLHSHTPPTATDV